MIYARVLILILRLISLLAHNELSIIKPCVIITTLQKQQ